MDTALARLMADSIIDGDCLLWTGAATDGYGVVTIDGKPWKVHRLAYIARHGDPPPETPHVRHTCDVRNCWADRHLILGTHKQNMADRDQRGRNGHSNKTRCPQQHPYDAGNTRVDSNGLW